MKIIDGKATAAAIRSELAAEIKKTRVSGARAPGLAVILVGDDHSSQIYVRNKQRACSEVGILSFPFILPADTSQQKVVDLIKELNGREDIDGILAQLPLPAHIDAKACTLAIDPSKDVDGFHPFNVGRHVLGMKAFLPCTPAGIMELLKRSNLDVSGKKAVIVGRSDIVGKPLARMLVDKATNATVTLCHSGTKNLKKECQEADYLFLAMGKPRAIDGSMVKEGCVVVDVGINRVEDGICGDADFASVSERAAAITPVPGGVGPMTIAMLLKNTVLSWKDRMMANPGTPTNSKGA